MNANSKLIKKIYEKLLIIMKQIAITIIYQIYCEMQIKGLTFWHPKILKQRQKINLYNVRLNLNNKNLVYNEKIEGVDKI